MFTSGLQIQNTCIHIHRQTQKQRVTQNNRDQGMHSVPAYHLHFFTYFWCMQFPRFLNQIPNVFSFDIFSNSLITLLFFF